MKQIENKEKYKQNFDFLSVPLSQYFRGKLNFLSKISPENITHDRKSVMLSKDHLVSHTSHLNVIELKITYSARDFSIFLSSS